MSRKKCLFGYSGKAKCLDAGERRTIPGEDYRSRSDGDMRTEMQAGMEKALDAIVAAHGNPYVAFPLEAAAGIEGTALGKHAPHGIEGFDGSPLGRLAVDNTVQVAQHGAIQKAQDTVGIGLPLYAAAPLRFCFPASAARPARGPGGRTNAPPLRVPSPPEKPDRGSAAGRSPRRRQRLRNNLLDRLSIAPIHRRAVGPTPRNRPLGPTNIIAIALEKGDVAAHGADRGCPVATVIAQYEGRREAAQAAVVSFLVLPPNSTRSLPFFV